MEPKIIKKERETTKEEPTNEEAASEFRSSSLVQNLANQETASEFRGSSLVQNLTNQELRNARNKGI